MKKNILFILLSYFYCAAYAQTDKLDNEQLLDMVQGQRYAEAASYIRSVYPGIITDQKIKSRLAYCNYMSGNLADAERSYLSILHSDTTNRTALNYLAAISERRRNYLLAKNFYEKMLKLDSLNYTVYKKMAAVAENLRDTSGIFTNLIKANKLNPRDPDVAYDLSNILRKTKQYPFADTVLRKAIEADPQNILLINGRMELAYSLEDYNQAVNYAKQAIDLGDNAAQTFSILAKGNYYLKNYLDCIKIFNLMEGTPNSNETTYYFTALSYRKLDSLQKSNKYLELSISSGISENIPVYYQELSINNEGLKKFKTSISLLNKAEEFKTKNVFNYSRARIYDFNLNDPKNALKYYKRYIKDYDKEEDNKDSYTYSLRRVKDLSPKPAIKK